MCLTINRNFRTVAEAKAFKPKVAKRNIKVFKVFRIAGEQLYSPYKNFHYHRGFHYFQNGKPFTKNVYRVVRHDCRLQIFEGFHSYRAKPEGRWYSVIECIVPKGSFYYMNRKEIVSSQLIIPEE